jgi:hypothetical protein
MNKIGINPQYPWDREGRQGLNYYGLRMET